ncbi:MAG TPA: insulinase family protein [Candidatus Limenecus avicola]|uniref:Insulinase family protein n=1 Tax=Candidatus Limenecus avicola TaxID=2840847 RepID=A0A9D1MYV6_9CLOT|nr:zinc protease [Clostridium sp. CAG:306]HIU91964.1 insulinase family protein [Candidatus Limenecus avicola]
MENIIKKEIQYPYLTKPVEIYERQNGHKIVLAHKEGGLVNISSWVKTGSINENDENNGISHFLEHLMFKGTHKHKAGYFDKTLESKGAIVNAATWKDYTFYYVTLPQGPDGEYFKLAIELHADMMLDPVIPEEEIGVAFNLGDDSVPQKRERHVVIEEIRMRQDQPWTKIYNSTNKNMYTNHPYKRDVIGFPQTIASIPRETILEYYRTHYTPNNITTIVAGDFNHEEVLEKVCKEFDFKGRENYNNPKQVLDTPVTEEKYIELKGKINTGFSITGWLGPVAREVKDNIGLEIINIVLGEGQSSRLYQNLIEQAKEPIFNVVATDYYSFKDGGNFFVQANFKADKKEEALKLIKDEIQKILNKDMTQKEFEKAKKKLKVRFAQGAETVSEIAESIGYYMTVCDDLDLAESYLNDLENYTLEEANKTAQKYLQLQNSVTTVLLPE